MPARQVMGPVGTLCAISGSDDTRYYNCAQVCYSLPAECAFNGCTASTYAPMWQHLLKGCAIMADTYVKLLESSNHRFLYVHVA